MRGGLGVGYLHQSNELSAGSESMSFSIEGVAAGLRGEVQGRVADGLYLGGALGLERVRDPTISWDEGEVEAKDVALTAWSLGPVLTYYFAEDRGFHVSGFAGMVGVKLTQGSGGEESESDTEWGPSLAGTLGYDFSMGRDGTLGAQIQLLWATLSSEESGVNTSSTVITPLFTISGTFGGRKGR